MGEAGLTIGGAVIISFITWTVLFWLIFFLQPHRSYRWNGRMVACIHGIVISLLSLVFGIWFNPSPFTEPGSESNVYEVLVMVICLGYFIFDSFWCLWSNVYGKETNLFIIHHMVAFAGMVTSLYLGVSGTETNSTIFLAEVTNPLMQFRWFMREVGLKVHNVWYEINDFIFIVTYLTLRVGLSLYLAYCEVIHPQPTDIFKFLAVSFTVMNIILSVGIAQFAYRKYTVMYKDIKQWNNTGERQLCVKDYGQLRNGSTTFDREHGD
ncbi:TLC domain-containing protein 5-like [Asterias rubens]|uniref:TLC domain-containing protein 5-like n=1 Tax=Asterias rubens TaxID=7604 RepID=UPI0014551C70|nr:TLC domain-containing protein 5-like [Asterias rubens]